MNNVPKGGRGVSSGKLMTIYDHAAAQSLLVSGEGKQNGQVGEPVTLTPATPSVVWAPGRRHLLPQEAVGSSGLGNLLAPGRAGREPCCCALLCAEAVLILQEEGIERYSQARGPQGWPQLSRGEAAPAEPWVEGMLGAGAGMSLCMSVCARVCVCQAQEGQWVGAFTVSASAG